MKNCLERNAVYDCFGIDIVLMIWMYNLNILMKLIIGDNTGLIKNVQVENESVVCKYGEQGKY